MPPSPAAPPAPGHSTPSCSLPSLSSSFSRRPAEGKQNGLGVVSHPGIERKTDLAAQRTDRRKPANPEAGGGAQLVEPDSLRPRERLPGVEEDDPLQPERPDQGKDDLVVEDQLLTATDLITPGELGASVVTQRALVVRLLRLVEHGHLRPERTCRVAAYRVDAARK